MRVSVVGVGAVGGALAALLDRAGLDVTAVARGETAERIQQRGLSLEGARGRHVARLTVAETPPPDSDLVALAVRSFEVAAALDEHGAAIGDRPVLLMQNGLDAPGTAQRVLERPDGRAIFAGLALFPASRVEPGRVRLTGAGALRIGAAHPAGFPEAEAIATVFAAALPTLAIARLRGALWMKLLVNHVNALPAITNMSVQAVCRHPLLAPILAQALTDAVAVADALKVRFAGVGVLEPAHVAEIRAGRALHVVRGRLATAFGVRPNPASTLQAIRRGAHTEINDLDGAVVREARRARRRAPIHERLVELVLAAERTGNYLSPTVVAERIWR